MNILKKGLITLFIGISLSLIANISFAETGTVDAPSGLVLRKEASKTAEPITTVTDKSKVEIIEKTEEWYKVKYNNYEGYLFAKYVAIDEEKKVEEEKPQEEVIQNKEENADKEYPKQIETKTELKVYIIPSITSTVIMNIEAQKSVTINYILNDWANITYENKTGWVRKRIALDEINVIQNEQTQENEVTATEKPKQETVENKVEEKTYESKKGYIDVTTSANLRKEANTSAEVLTTLIRNTQVTIIGEEADFYKIEYKDYTGYISKSLISDKAVEVTNRSSESRKTTENIQTEVVEQNNVQSSEQVIQNTNSGAGQRVAEFALQYKGYSYVSGGTTPSGFDCSGFVYYVFNTCGYSLSRSCQVQAKSGSGVSKENLQAGDILFFCNGSNGSIGHVGIYIGNGNMIHAANSRRGVVIDTINSGYYQKYYYSARRIAE